MNFGTTCWSSSFSPPQVKASFQRTHSDSGRAWGAQSSHPVASLPWTSPPLGSETAPMQGRHNASHMEAQFAPYNRWIGVHFCWRKGLLLPNLPGGFYACQGPATSSTRLLLPNPSWTIVHCCLPKSGFSFEPTLSGPA